MGFARIVVGLAIALAAAASPADAQKRYDPGASDTEIKVGNIMPYSGPASAYGVIGRTETAYFNKINAEGGINGRRIVFISYDDAYSPPKTVEQARKLVESDEVATERPVDGPLVIGASARARLPAKAMTEADKASVFNITNILC